MKTANMKTAARRMVVLASLLGMLSSTLVAGAVAAPQRPPVVEAVMAGQQVTWRECGSGLRCATISVPADWSDPARSPRTRVGLAKLPARDQSRKVGTLLHSPGGPAQAIEFLPLTKDAYAELTEWFDVVVFDPRGFGTSGAVACPRQAPFLLEWASPSPGDYADFAAANGGFARACEAAIGPLRGRLNSWQVAHDMDAIRVALGERRLSYFGNSYGTVFGQAYAELFGGNVARMYLDSVMDHTDPDLSRWTASKAVVAERNLHRFAAWCAGSTDCALHGQDALAVWDRVIATAEREPIPAPGAGAGVTASAALILAQARLNNQAGWPGTARALAQADAGDASAFVPRLPPPPGALAPDLSRVMLCADFPYETGYEPLKRLEDRLRRRGSPRVGRVHAWSTAAVHCAGLPRGGPFPPHPIRSTRGLPPVLVANGSDDSVTPPGHGLRVTRQLPRARYLPAAGGHALYLGGHRCVREHVHRYLVTGKLPPPGRSCPSAGDVARAGA